MNRYRSQSPPKGMRSAVSCMGKRNRAIKNGYNYEWRVTRTDSLGYAYVTTPTVPTTVGAHVSCEIYCEECGVYGRTNSGSTAEGYMVPKTAYVGVMATSDNEFTDNMGTHYGTVWMASGSFWVCGSLVVSHVREYKSST